MLGTSMVLAMVRRPSVLKASSVFKPVNPGTSLMPRSASRRTECQLPSGMVGPLGPMDIAHSGRLCYAPHGTNAPISVSPATFCR